MKTQHPQSAQTAIDPLQNATFPEERASRRGLIAMATTVAAAGGVGLATLLLGLTAGARAEAPPSPGVAPSVETAVHSDGSGLDNVARFVVTADGECRFDPRYLPHTPDAVEGWYASCRARMADSGKHSRTAHAGSIRRGPHH